MKAHHRFARIVILLTNPLQWVNRIFIDIRQQHGIDSFGYSRGNHIGTIRIKIGQIKMGMGVDQSHAAKLTSIVLPLLSDL
jgi:hypothetical protein